MDRFEDMFEIRERNDNVTDTSLGASVVTESGVATNVQSPDPALRFDGRRSKRTCHPSKR